MWSFLTLTLKDLLKAKVIQVLVPDMCGTFVLRLTFQDLLKAKVIQVWLQTGVELFFKTHLSGSPQSQSYLGSRCAGRA